MKNRKLFDTVILNSSLFNEQEFTVILKDTNETIGIIKEVTCTAPNQFTAMSINGKHLEASSREMAMLFLLGCKASREKKTKVDPNQRTMMDLL